MINRRQFIEAGLAVSAVGGLAAVAPCAADERFLAPGVALRAVVFDERFAAARHFAEAARRRGLAPYATRGDVTELWYSRLHPLWRRERAAVAGLTAYAALFCLERLAWDHGMRVIRRAALGGPGGQPLHAWVIALPERPGRRNA
jgi:hypothetical protein